MKRFFHVHLLLLFSTTLGVAQFYISPLIGVDFARLESAPSRPGYQGIYITNKGFEVNSTFFGIKLTHRLNSRFSLSGNLSFTSKEVNASFYYYDPLDGFNFNYYRSRLSFCFGPISNFSLGAGINLNFIADLVGRDYDRGKVDCTLTRDSLIKDMGVSLQVGYSWKNFELEAYYYHGIGSYRQYDFYLKPIQSIGIALGYNIKIFDRGKRGKKVDCPKV
jgi:hypothetical protein